MSDVKISADQQTRNRFNLSESVSAEEAPNLVKKINANKEFRASMEDNTLVVRQFLRD